MTLAETGRAPVGAPRLHDRVETSNLESSQTAISWGAVFGGAVAALAATFALISLGSALGFAFLSPWTADSASLVEVGVGAAIWLVVVQWLASAFGGYLAGRLRTKWAVMGSDEVFFRDTAHGFLAWGLSTVVAVALFASVIGSGAHIAATVATEPAQAAASGSAPMASYVDTLFRAGPNAAAPATDRSAADIRGESGRILARAATTDIAPADRTYLAQLVSSQTGLSPADAAARVNAVITTTKEDADKARKAASSVAFLTALSLVIGAFVAAAAGALGGRHRDEI